MGQAVLKTPQDEPYLAEIKDLLANYRDGWDVFKVADDWDYKLTLNEGVHDRNLPENWIELADKVISIIALKKYGLDTYPNVIEIIEAEHMLDAYASGGLPNMYDHWSFGMERTQLDKAYHGGQMGLAYEIVINTNPAIAYCMADNTKTMQMLVIAHANYGHNSFFKCNHLFKQFTRADEIIGDLARLKQLVSESEQRYGVQEVERILDACHSLESHGVNRYTKPKRRTPEEEEQRRLRIEDARQASFDDVMERTGSGLKARNAFKETDIVIPSDMEENLLRYIASDAPHLKPWQRELIKLASEKAQYFYPNRQTKVMNEGWASFWHYTLMNDLHSLGLIDDGMCLEFLTSHAGVLFQPEFDSKYYDGSMNPYALGFAIYNDIRRVCENPTDEDREWFPHLAGKGNWLAEITYAMENFKDESFILQYLSPKVMRDFKFFAIQDDDQDPTIEVTAIHDDDGYRRVRSDLASQYRLGDQQPRIEVAGYDYKGDRMLTLQHTTYNRKPLDEKDMQEVLKHVYQLWGHPVVLNSVDPEGNIITSLSCPIVTSPKGPVKPSNDKK